MSRGKEGVEHGRGPRTLSSRDSIWIFVQESTEFLVTPWGRSAFLSMAGLKSQPLSSLIPAKQH